MDIRDKALGWFANGRVGASSRTMLCCALDIDEKDPFGPSHPHDPADLNRCLLMIEQVPEVKLAYHKIAKLSPEWTALIAQWEALEERFVDEVGRNWCSGRNAPDTYRMMKELIGGARAQPEPDRQER